MEARKITREYRMRQWAGLVTECRSSGMTVKRWCEEQGVNIKSYYYRQRRIREVAGDNLAMLSGTEHKMTPKQVFAEIKSARTEAYRAAVTLRLADAVLEIYNEAEQSTIEKTLQALKSLC